MPFGAAFVQETTIFREFGPDDASGHQFIYSYETLAERLMRALEVPLLTGRTLPWWQRNSPPAAEPVVSWTSVRPWIITLPT